MLQERRLQILFCAGTGDTTTEEVTQATSTKSKRFPEGGEAHPAVLAGDALARMMPWGGGKGRDEDLPPPRTALGGAPLTANSQPVYASEAKRSIPHLAIVMKSY